MIDPVGLARRQHQMLRLQQQQMAGQLPVQAQPQQQVVAPQHGLDISRNLAGALGSIGGWSGGAMLASKLLGAVPHPAAKIASFGIPLVASALGGALATGGVDAVAPGLHDAVNRNAGTAAGIGAAAAIPLGLMALRRGRMAPAVTPAAALPGPAAMAALPVNPSVRMAPGPVGPVVNPLTGAAVAGGATPSVFRPPVAAPAVHVAPSPSTVAPMLTADQFMNGVRAAKPDFGALAPTRAMMMPGLGLPPGALKAVGKPPVIAEAAVIPKAAMRLSKKKVEPPAEITGLTKPAKADPEFARLTAEHANDPPEIRIGELAAAIRDHGPKAAEEFAKKQKSAGKPPLTEEEGRYLEIATRKIGNPQQSARPGTGLPKRTAVQAADAAAMKLEKRRAEKPLPKSEPRITPETMPKPVEQSGISGQLPIGERVSKTNKLPVEPLSAAEQLPTSLIGSKKRLYDVLQRGMDTKLSTAKGVEGRAKIAREVIKGESKPVRDALRAHLKANHPDIHEHFEQRALAKAEMRSNEPVPSESKPAAMTPEMEKMVGGIPPRGAGKPPTDDGVVESTAGLKPNPVPKVEEQNAIGQERQPRERGPELQGGNRVGQIESPELGNSPQRPAPSEGTAAVPQAEGQNPKADAAPEAVKSETPKYQRTTPSPTEGAAERESLHLRHGELQDQIRQIEKDYAENQGILSKTPRGHTKKRQAMDAEASEMRKRASELRGQQRELTRQSDLAHIEDVLENPPSHEHYLKAMADLHELKRGQHSDMIDRTDKMRGLGKEEVDRIAGQASHHQHEADRHSLELLDSIKSKVPTDKLNKDEIESVAHDVIRDFGPRTNLASAIDQSTKRRLEHRTAYGQTDIDKFTHLDEPAKQQFKAELAKAAEHGPDWHAKSSEVIAKAKGENDKLAKVADETRKKAADEALAKSEIARAGKLKESREQNRHNLQEPRYFEHVNERAKALKGTVEKIPQTGTIDVNAERLLEREVVNPTWTIEKWMRKDDKGKLGPVYDLKLNKTGDVATSVKSPQHAKQFITMLDDQGVNMNHYAGKESPDDFKKAYNRTQTAWSDEHFGAMPEDMQKTALAKLPAKPSNVKADIVLDADDLGYGHPSGTRITKAKINDKIKDLATEVPEFAHNPVFTVSDKKKLVFRDGYKFEFDPEAFNVHASELKPGQTVGINLEDLGIKRPSQSEVVAGVLKNAGWNNVKVNKAGGVSASFKPGGTATMFAQDKGEWFATGADAKTGHGLLKEIRWTQPGQDAPEKTHAGVRPAVPSDKEFGADLDYDTRITDAQAAKRKAAAEGAAKHLADVAKIQAAKKPKTKIEKLSAKPAEPTAEKPKIESLSAKPAKEQKVKPKIERLSVKSEPVPTVVQNPYGDTPAGKAYSSAKSEHPNAIVLLKRGHTYEMFGSDATNASKALGISTSTLDKSSKNPITIAGFGHDKLEGYLKQLVAAGHKVSITEGK